MKLDYLRGVLFFLFLLCSMGVWADQCKKNSGSIKYIKHAVIQGMFTVEGDLAEFDPCSHTVTYIPPRTVDGPLMMIVHGGRGLSRDMLNQRDAFRALGYGVLLFDAFVMNDRWKDQEFWGLRVDNEARQRMIYKVTLGAYVWLTNVKKVNPKNIYYYGTSNGGAVVANLAADLRVDGGAFFAEAAPGFGIGLPNKVLRPLVMIYGTRDNFAGSHAKEWIWTRITHCLMNTDKFDGPEGNAGICNKSNYWNVKNNLTESPMEWLEGRKRDGQPVDLVWLEGAGHSVFFGELTESRNAYGSSENIRFSTVGGSRSAVDQVLKEIKSRIGE